MRTVKLFLGIISCGSSLLYLVYYVVFLHITLKSLIALICCVVFWKTLTFVLSNKVVYDAELAQKQANKTYLVQLLNKI